MKIKIIKKGTEAVNKSTYIRSKKSESKPRVEETVTQNVMGWVTELREKKHFEFVTAQNLLSSFR